MTDLEFIPPAKPIIGQEERDAVDKVLATGMLAQGPVVKAFEEEFSQVLSDGRACVAVNSGTSGLHLGLVASGIGPGDEVIVPAFTFAATGNAVALTGATPVFADIDPDTFCLDPVSVERLISSKTRAIMPVHLYGHPAAMDELETIAKRHSLLLFEDAAQAHGAAINGRRVGTFGTFGMFSLYPTKNMTSGEGGMVTTGDSEVERKLRLLRNQGMKVQYQNELVGYNNRMTDIHAAIGRVQLTRVGEWTNIRRRNAAFLDANLRGVKVPFVAPGADHVYHQYTIRLEGFTSDERDSFGKELKDRFAVGSGVYYPVPTNDLPSFQQRAELPETAKATQEVLSLPVHPSLTQNHLERIVEAVNTLAGAGA